jgi:hypothetical protein
VEEVAGVALWVAALVALSVVEFLRELVCVVLVNLFG